MPVTALGSAGILAWEDETDDVVRVESLQQPDTIRLDHVIWR